jgi:hypothetical protein
MICFEESEHETGDTFKSMARCMADALDSAALALSLEPRCESPIEVELGVKISKALRVIEDPTLSLGTRYALASFRYDLIIVREGRLDPLVIIECDGKEFHSTIEQKVNDRWKDNLAKARGIRLLRFTGSEIHRTPDLCVATLLQVMRYDGHLTSEQCDRLKAAGIRRHRPVPVYATG